MKERNEVEIVGNVSRVYRLTNKVTNGKKETHTDDRTKENKVL